MIKYKIVSVSPLEVSDRKVLRLYSSDSSVLILVNQYVSFWV